MNENPLVSVCIGTYNRERYIRECLDSVFAQTYPNIEVIVVDNASTDRTVEFLEKYGERIRVVRRQTNSDMCSTTRNQAAQLAKGAYIAFLDSDDSWYPEKIEKQVQFMQANESVALCHTYCRIMDAKSAEQGIRHEGNIPLSGKYFEALLEHCWITISSVLIRSGIYEECGPFTEAFPYARVGEDVEFFLKVARRYDIGFIPEVLVKYRKGSDGVSGGYWQAVPEAFPFFWCLQDRRDIWEGIVSQSKMDRILRNSAFTSSRYWRDQGYGLRGAYFPARLLLKHPLCGTAWMELIRSLFCMLLPGAAGKGL